MNASALNACIPSCATLRSLEAYVVPHFLAVTAGARGTVTSVLFENTSSVRLFARFAIVQRRRSTLW